MSDAALPDETLIAYLDAIERVIEAEETDADYQVLEEIWTYFDDMIRRPRSLVASAVAGPAGGDR